MLRVLGKGEEQREVPLHTSTTRALGDYARVRDRHSPAPTSPAFFLNMTGGRRAHWAVYRSSWLERRDIALLLTTIQTGLPVSELTNLRLRDVTLTRPGAHCRVIGKGRKMRSTILTAETVAVLQEWLRERGGDPSDPVFPTRRGEPLTPRGVAWLLDKHVATATIECPSLASKRVTPHTLRHTNAMLLRAKKVDILTIALWLGHESTTSTEIYLHADNTLKQEAIDRTTPTGTTPGRYQPSDTVIAFLEQL